MDYFYDQYGVVLYGPTDVGVIYQYLNEVYDRHNLPYNINFKWKSQISKSGMISYMNKSLMSGQTAILHSGPSYIKELPYYTTAYPYCEQNTTTSTSSGHYITIMGYDEETQMVILADCNYVEIGNDDIYYGIFAVHVDHIYAALSSIVYYDIPN